MKVLKFTVIVAGIFVALYFIGKPFLLQNLPPSLQKLNNSISPSQENTQTVYTTGQQEAVTIVAKNLEVPWALAFLPDNTMLFTERPGRVRMIKNGVLQKAPIATLDDVTPVGESGLLGIAVHPNFSTNQYIYLYYTYSSNNDNTLNRVVRYKLENDTLTQKTILVDAIPGASNHDGGRIKFGPDNYLYIATGDAQEPSLAQNIKSLAGKILRVTDDGKAAPGNPFGNLVYSYGHRNPQGIAWNSNKTLWETEHGRSGVLSGFDEVNLIESGKNYGWPEIQGDETRSGMVTPKKHSGETTTWAPSGAVFSDNSLFFAGLRGQTLYEAVIQDNQVTKLNEHFKNKYGRLREVVLGPDRMLYITTSNHDGRGTPQADDDKIIRVDPKTL